MNELTKMNTTLPPISFLSLSVISALIKFQIFKLRATPKRHPNAHQHIIIDTIRLTASKISRGRKSVHKIDILREVAEHLFL